MIASKQTAALEDVDRVLHTRAGRRVEYLSIAWTSLEAIIGVAVGILAGSVALITFGADSIIEVASSCVLLWWLAEGSIDRDRAAHRLVGACFFALAAYIATAAAVDLLKHHAPRATYVGIIYAGACVIVMPLLARAKRGVARGLIVMPFMLIFIRATSAHISRSSCFSVWHLMRFSGGGGPIQLLLFVCYRSLFVKGLPDGEVRPVHTPIFEMQNGCPVLFLGQL